MKPSTQDLHKVETIRNGIATCALISMKTLTKILIILYDIAKYLNAHILKFRLYHNDI